MYYKIAVGKTYYLNCMPVKVSRKGQLVLPAGLRKKYGIAAGKNVDILDFGNEIVIVSVPESRGRGFLKFRKKLSEIISVYKKEEKLLESKQ